MIPLNKGAFGFQRGYFFNNLIYRIVSITALQS